MSKLNAIIETEFRYGSAMGAKILDLSNSVRVSDDRIPERDAYNYVFVSQEASFEEAEATVKEELRRFEQLNLPHSKIVFHPESLHWQTIEVLDSFSYTARFIMVLPLTDCATPEPDENCKVLEARDFEALHEFEWCMYVSKGSWYASHQTELKLDTYSKKNEFEVIVYSVDGRVVGDVELFADNGIVKFDDFKVHQEYRCRGYGKKLQRFAMSRACRNGVSHIYAITDDNGFVKELYRKDGFVEAGILHTFRKSRRS
ncbi:MAG TPA: N-acetyltransferase [Chlorobaculum parvum]|uniref:N-acetyltransferase n=1 Tax=Chlorobaculum parvum TaxID=274539 RepID=A0A7C5HKL8_9CHLB|nr:N-acetyltransferase [Chlorobaculum parvum]